MRELLDLLAQTNAQAARTLKELLLQKVQGDGAMTRALVPQTHSIADLLGDVTSKDARHRVGVFVAWMRETGGNWQTPDLSDYRDHLLTVSGLAPASVAAHLSTVRGRYKRLLESNSMRQYLYSLAPDDASAADRKAFVDETLAQLENAVKANAAPLTVVKHQDDLDAGHLRLTIEQALDLLDSPARDARNTRREALRDAALLALMLCTGLREMEVCALNVDDLRQKVDRQLGVSVRQGKGAKARFVPYGGLIWCLEYVDAWLASAGISSGAVFRGLRKAKDGQEKPVRPARLSVRAVQDILKRYPVYEDGKALHAAPHDLRRTYARLLHDAGVPWSPFSRISVTRTLKQRCAMSAI